MRLLDIGEAQSHVASVIDGTPKLETTEVLNSTFHQIRAGKLVAA